MNVLVIGEEPSKKTKNNPTLRKLKEWLDYLNIKIVSFTNVSNPEWVDSAKLHIKIVALGNMASQELVKHQIIHFKLPHPSPRNRQLNDHIFVKRQLDECKAYLVGPA